MLELALFHYSEAKDWHFFQIAEREHRARLKGDRLEEALRAMLHVVFDASCECDELGYLITSSRHMQDLIGKSSHEHDGLTLGSLAATPFEAERITAFLTQIASVQGRTDAEQSLSPPALLETSFKVCDQAVSEMRVKLCCVRLSVDTVAGQAANRFGGQQRLLVGLQRIQTSDLGISLSDGSPQAQPLDAGAVEAQQVSHESGKSSETRSEEGSDCHNQERAPAGHAIRRKVAATLSTMRLAVAARAAESSIRVIDADQRSHVSGSLASLSLSGTHVTGGEFSRFMPETCHIDVATQTIALPPTPNVDLQSQAVQTDYSSYRRPPLPAGTAARSREPQVKEKKCTRRTSKPFLERWCGTPAATIEFMMTEVLMQLNPIGKGCCFWHVAIHLASTALKSMASRGCQENYFPHSGWQCRDCWALNESIVDGEDEDGVHCSVCNRPKPSMSEGNASAVLADVDSNYADGSGHNSAAESDFSSQ